MFRNEYPLSTYPESLKSLLFGTDLTLLLEQYIGQHTTIARKLCLQSFRHLRHKSLYVLLPVLGLIKKYHSCFNFFDNLAIEKTPFTHLDKGCRNAHPKSSDFKKIFNTPSLVWNEKRFLGGVFEKFFWKNKNLLSIHRTERRKWVESYKIVKYRSETEALQTNFPNLKICWFWETKRQKWV